MSDFGIRNHIIDETIILNDLPMEIRECLFQTMWQDFNAKGLNLLTETSSSSIELKLCRMNGVSLTPDELTKQKAVLNKIHLFLRNSEYYKVFEFCEDYLTILGEDIRKVRVKEFNAILTHGNIGFRATASGNFLKCTDEEAVEEINRSVTTKYEKVNAHFRNALKKYSFSADWQGCITESFNGLETLLSILLNKRASFGKLLDEARKRGVVLHETLKKSLDCLYGYASQVARHGSKDEYNPNDAEARFVLITLSALCNLMIASFEGAIVKS